MWLIKNRFYFTLNKIVASVKRIGILLLYLRTSLFLSVLKIVFYCTNENNKLIKKVNTIIFIVLEYVYATLWDVIM